MTHLRNTILSALFVLLLSPAFAISQDKASNHVFGASITFTTNYMYRGVTASDNMPAGQGDVSYSYTPFGFYASVWASSIDFDDGDSNVEVDYIVGFTGEINSHLEWDVGFLYYTYPDSSIEPDYDYLEIYAGLTYTFEKLPLSPSLGGKFSYSPEYFGEDGDAIYIEGGVDFNLPLEITLSAHVGYLDVEGADTTGPAGYDFTDFSVGLSKDFFGFTADLTFTTVSDQADACGNTNWCDEHVVFSLSRSF